MCFGLRSDVDADKDVDLQLNIPNINISSPERYKWLEKYFIFHRFSTS